MAVIAIEPEVKAAFFFQTNKSNDSIQYKRTHLPFLCAECTLHCVCLCIYSMGNNWNNKLFVAEGIIARFALMQMHVWTNM